MNASCRFQFSESLPEQVPADSPYSGSSHLPQIKESSEKQLKRQLPNVYYVFHITKRESGSLFMPLPSIFEALMLICFGFSWPFAIMKTVKVKNPAGKIYIFLFLNIATAIPTSIINIGTAKIIVFILTSS